MAFSDVEATLRDLVGPNPLVEDNQHLRLLVGGKPVQSHCSTADYEVLSGVGAASSVELIPVKGFQSMTRGVPFIFRYLLGLGFQSIKVMANFIGAH